MVSVPLLRWTIDNAAGEAETVKLGVFVGVGVGVFVGVAVGPVIGVMVGVGVGVGFGVAVGPEFGTGVFVGVGVGVGVGFATVRVMVVDPSSSHSVLDKFPIAEMVIVAVPIVALLPAVRVSTLLSVVEVGVKAAVTPLGRLPASKVTPPANSPAVTPVTEIVLVPLPPRGIVRLAGEAETVKLGGFALTVSARVAVAVFAPVFPEIVTLVLPTAAEQLAAIVYTAPPRGVGTASNVAVTPLGNPDSV
jgi:hypothetical protein